MARSFNIAGEFTDKAALVEKLAALKNEGYQRLGSSGSKLPAGVHEAEIKSYRLILGSDTDANAKYALVLYTIAVQHKGTTIEDTVLSSEEGDNIMNVGTVRKVQPFIDSRGRKLNQFVQSVEGAENMPPASGEQTGSTVGSEGTMRTVGQTNP